MIYDKEGKSFLPYFLIALGVLLAVGGAIGSIIFMFCNVQSFSSASSFISSLFLGVFGSLVIGVFIALYGYNLK